ncbi:transcription factor bHLH68 [Arachis duranensis]|uniref:Transcription factor bHLH68 n=1 Tax=Arachis duranensis TaxID=130453 RepID=A0A9C6TS08_ARADU|nr:transcription factor bHLH68 [Arachis duranensis]
MNRGGGVVEQMMGSGNPNCWNSPSSDFLSYSSTTNTPSSYTNFLLNPPPPYVPHPPTSYWHEHEHEHHNNTNPELPVVGEEENGRGIWQHHASELDDVKQERSVESSYVYGDGSAGKPNWSHNQMILLPPNASSSSNSTSPKSSCVTFTTSILDFSTQPTLPPPPPPPPSSAECNSIAGGGASKKARVQQSTSSATFKVRKEKLGDRIAALHQLVSPFGKTDTASVLLEAIGYIRFLQSQIEALSLPYLVNGSPNMKHQNPVQGEKSCLFPEDPGQLLNENCLKKRKATTQQEGSQHQEEAKKDLRSRGLCLVPVSCTLQVGSDNGADYWSPAFGAGGFR